jgi:hypothetical protein
MEVSTLSNSQVDLPHYVDDILNKDLSRNEERVRYHIRRPLAARPTIYVSSVELMRQILRHSENFDKQAYDPVSV